MVKAERTHAGLSEIRDIIEGSFVFRDPVENVEARSIFGRVLAEDIVAVKNLPHYPSSAVDGYGVISDQTAHAATSTPVLLQPGEFAWVNTGRRLDTRFDAVIMVEDTTLLPSGEIVVSRALPSGENVRPVGEDISRGQILCRKNERVTPYMHSLLIAAGPRTVPVRPHLKCVYIPTGDEIVDPGEWLEEIHPLEDRMPETNSAMLSGVFGQWNRQLDIVPVVADDPEALEAAVEKASGSYDIILVGAGTAKGERDFTADVLSRRGRVLCHWFRVKPGRPAMIAEFEGKPVVAMPGFPMSSLVTAWNIVHPLLEFLDTGSADPDWEKALASINHENTFALFHHSSPQGVSEWLRVKCAAIGNRKHSWIMPSGSSGMLSIAESDGFALLSEERLELPKGGPLDVWMVRNVDWEKRFLYQGSNDPAIERIVSCVRARGADMAIRSVGSMGGLAALARGEGHMAACHLLDPDSGTYNDSYIERFSGGREWKRKLLYFREQGILTAPGNPGDINSVRDISLNGYKIVNRQPGAGTRVLLDHLLDVEGIESREIAGYEEQALTHLDAAARVAAGTADAAIGIRAAAEAFALSFTPLVKEPFEIVYPAEFEYHPGIRAFMESVEDQGWRGVVEDLGGYSWKY